MNKIKLTFVVSIMLLSAIFLLGCSSSPDKVLVDAISKNSKITYSKQDADISIGIAGMAVNIKATGEIDSKNQKSAFKVTSNSPLLQESNISMEMYSDKEVMYIKDPSSDMYTKLAIQKDNKGLNNAGISVAGSLLTQLKDDKSIKESIKMKSGENSEKIITADISSEFASSLFNNLIESQGTLSTIESAIESQLITMAEESGVVGKSKEEITKAAKEEAKKLVEEYKVSLKKLQFENFKYTGKVNKDGYLHGEEISIDVVEKSTGMTLNLKITTKLSDINMEKSVSIPNIPKDKISTM